MTEGTILQRIGYRIDRNYLKKAGATSVPGSRLDVLLICYHPYHGKTQLTIPGGKTGAPTLINPGDPIVEIHLSNIRIIQIAQEPSERSMEWRLLEMLREELGKLAQACKEGEIPYEVKGFYGVNVLSAGAKRLGFTLVPLPKGWNRWWLGFWESLLRKIYYSFKTKKKATFGRTQNPFEIWISREELLNRYLSK